MTRPRWSWIWRSRWPWVGTAWPISRCCAANRDFTGRWPPTRRSRAQLLRWPATPRRCWLRSMPPGRSPARAWKVAGAHAPNHGASARTPLIVDLDATLVGSHSEKEQAAPTYKKGFGFHPLWSFVDHGAAGTGEPLSVLLRPGNAGSTPPRFAGGTPHRDRPHCCYQGRPGSAARPPPGQTCGPQGADPHRRRWVHPQGPGLDERSAPVVLGRVPVAPQHV